MIAICLDLVLVTLLLLAVWIGFRLERRLKVLRGSQEGFVNAVAELNGGIERAQSGLIELKSVTLEARSELADRIQDAKGMTSRLERQAAAAEQAAQRLEALIERAAAVQFPPPSRGRDEGRGAEPASPRPSWQTERASAFTARPPSPDPRGEGNDELVLRRAALSRPPAAERSRTRIDDDLFDAPMSVRGGRR
jgi:hypothetical protein